MKFTIDMLSMLEVMPDAIIVIDKTSKILFVNANTEKLFGYSRDQLVQDSLALLLPERFRYKHQTHINAYFQSPHVRPMGKGLNLQGLNRDGIEFPIEISLSPLSTEEGTVTLAAIRDVSERKQFEQVLREKNLELEKAMVEVQLQTSERLKAMEQTQIVEQQRAQEAVKYQQKQEEFKRLKIQLENEHLHKEIGERKRIEAKLNVLQKSIDAVSDYAIFLLDPKGQVMTWNQGAERIKGYKAEEIIGQSFKKFYSDELLAEHFPEQELALALTKGRFEDEGWRICKDGSTIWANVTITPIYNDEDQHTGFLKITRDLTARKRLEDELLQSERKRVKEAELHYQQQEEFVDTICHELRNPLNGIYGGTSLLQEELAAFEKLFREELASTLSIETALATYQTLNKIKDDIDIVRHCAQQQKVIVDDVLDFSKLENNKIELNNVIFNINQTAIILTKMFESQIKQKQLKIIFDLPQPNLVIKADQHRLMQILINLISNAIKFTEHGSIQIKIACESSDDNSRLQVSVEDTGIGMTTEEQAKLFNRFSQANRQISSQYGGSGLGLLISQKLVALMGGKIQVESQKWKGSHFYFTVNCLKPALAEENTLQTNMFPEQINPPSYTQFKDKHALIVDDNTINQKILMRFLEDKGFFCQLANNGAEAVDKYKNANFDIILMDIQMPIMNGLEATQAIRQLDKTRQKTTPIIGLSGNSRKEHIQEGLAVGMDDYLTKPYKKDDLYAVIGHYIKNTAVADSKYEKTSLALNTHINAPQSPFSLKGLYTQIPVVVSSSTALIKTDRNINQESNNPKNVSNNNLYSNTFLNSKKPATIQSAKEKVSDNDAVQSNNYQNRV